MSRLIIITAVIAVAACQGTNNGQNNANCTTCGQANGAADINDPAVQQTLGNLAGDLPFLSNMGFGTGQPAASGGGRVVGVTVTELGRLECPIPATFFETTRTEPTCTTNDNCNINNREVCCDWFGVKHCLRGIATAPRAGSCPAAEARGFPCRADFGGCRFDSECRNSNEKCCPNPDCGYSECTASIASAPTPTPTQNPTRQTSPVACTRIGCPPAPSPSCVNVGESFPNGPQCPRCRVCNDPLSPPAPTSRPQNVPCTRIGCPRAPGPDCVNIGQTFPNGPQCPSCRVCNDPPTPTTTEAVACTLIACPPAPGPDCVNIGETFPNGPRCPSCRVCNDPPTPTTTEAVACTLIACPPAPGPNCVNIGETFPNGPRCPSCRVCNDLSNAPQACTRRGCSRPPAGAGCRDVRISYPNGPRCNPECRYCADPVTSSAPQQTASVSMGVCRSALLYYSTKLNDCTQFSLSTGEPTNNAASHRSMQSCGAGTLFDLKMCLCNHSRLVNLATCKSA